MRKEHFVQWSKLGYHWTFSPGTVRNSG